MKETVVLNGNEYRVAANWNAIRDYCQRKGVTDLSKIGSVLCFGLDGVLTMAHCCIKEGERLEGRELGISEMELGEMFSPGMMTKSSNYGESSGSRKFKKKVSTITVDDYLGIALGLLGMGVMEFGEMLLHDFFLKLHYYNTREEQIYRANAELVRLQTLTLVNIQLQKKDKIKDPKQLWVFPWEREESVEVSRKEDNVESVIRMSKLL